MSFAFYGVIAADMMQKEPMLACCSDNIASFLN